MNYFNNFGVIKITRFLSTLLIISIVYLTKIIDLFYYREVHNIKKKTVHIYKKINMTSPQNFRSFVMRLTYYNYNQNKTYFLRSFLNFPLLLYIDDFVL